MHNCFLPTCGGNTVRIILGISIGCTLACFSLYVRHVLEEYLAASCSFPSYVCKFACHVLSAQCMFVFWSLCVSKVVRDQNVP